MTSSTNLKPTLDFLRELQANNNKAWFESHRAAYETARQRFEAFVDQFIAEFRPVEDFGDLSARDCVIRIHRDIRFSKDKSPYKTNMGADVVRGGRKSGNLGYYIHIAPHDQFFLAGGLHMPTSEQLGKFRQAIDRDAGEFRRIITNPKFVEYFGILGGEKLKSAPQGYARDHPEIELLKLKEVVAGHRLTDETVLSDDLLAHTVEVFTELKPFLDYLNRIMR